MSCQKEDFFFYIVAIVKSDVTAQGITLEITECWLTFDFLSTLYDNKSTYFYVSTYFFKEL